MPLLNNLLEELNTHQPIDALIPDLQGVIPSEKDFPIIEAIKQKMVEFVETNDPTDTERVEQLLSLDVIRKDQPFLFKLHYHAYAYKNVFSYCSTMQPIHDNYQSGIRFSREELTHPPKKIPKIIHYIWMGKTMPEHLVNNLSGVIAAAKKSGYQVQLWTDNIGKQEKIFNTLPKSARDILHIKSISELDPLIDAEFNKPVPGLNQTQANILKGFIQQEKSGFYNYAAASDLLRILILNFQGGIYLDADLPLYFDSPRTIGKLHSPCGFNEFIKIWEAQPDTPEIVQERNEVLMSAPHHPIIREALNVWFKILQEQRESALPEDIKEKTPFIPTMNDQRRFGQSQYEYLGNKDPMMGAFKPKELGTGTLGVLPISLAVHQYQKDYNQLHPDPIRLQDLAFGYERDPISCDAKIIVGNLEFKHVMEHAWLDNSMKKRKPAEI